LLQQSFDDYCGNYSKRYIVLEIASLLIGITSIVPLILPLAASLSAPENRGKSGRTIMSGLLVGLLSGSEQDRRSTWLA
jgi:hypothetical protein